MTHQLDTIIIGQLDYITFFSLFTWADPRKISVEGVSILGLGADNIGFCKIVQKNA